MPDADWSNARTQFVGWVPNVLGHLSFSLIGRSTTSDAHCASAEIDDVQEVAALQRRQADDRALPRVATRWVHPRSVHYWLLTAKSQAASYPSSKTSPACNPQGDVYNDPRGMLRGSIHILGGLSWKRAKLFKQIAFRWKRHRYRTELARALQKIAQSDSDQSSPTDVSDAILAKYKECGLDFARLEFCLFRTGEVRIWFEDESIIKNEGARQAVPKVAYFFLKDIAHLHTHHHKSQDGMIPFSQIEPNDADGEKSWQRRTIWALSRSIEEYVRRGTRADLRAAIGMIPYAENFHSLYGGLHRQSGELHKFVEIKDHEFDHYSFEGLRKMVSSLLDARSSTLAARAALTTAAIPITLSSVIAVNAVGTSPGETPHWPQWMRDVAFGYPHAIVPVILVLMFLIYRIAYRESNQDEWLFAPIKTYTRFIKALTVSVNRFLPFPPIVGYLVVVTAQVAALGATIFGFFKLLE